MKKETKEFKVDAYDYWSLAYYAARFVWFQLTSGKSVDYYEIKIATTEKTDFYCTSVDIPGKQFYVTVGYKRHGFNDIDELTKVLVDHNLVALLLLHVLADKL